jgi:transposase InsO family protein
MIRELSLSEPARKLCELLGVARGGYYAWLKRKQSANALKNQTLLPLIREEFQASRGNYGSPRITQALRARGHQCNHKRIERLMRQAGLKGRTGKPRRVRTTDSEHGQPIARNLLLTQPAPTRVDQVWVADITYVSTAEGPLFLAAIMDLYSRQILGWSLWENLEAGGPLQALARALIKRGHPRQVIHHSDRGIQYASTAYRQHLQRSGLIASMSRKANCYDNAAMEAFWSTLKREALDHSATWSKDRVRREIFLFIEADYNRKRLHSSLGYKSPVDFEQSNNNTTDNDVRGV